MQHEKSLDKLPPSLSSNWREGWGVRWRASKKLQSWEKSLSNPQNAFKNLISLTRIHFWISVADFGLLLSRRADWRQGQWPLQLETALQKTLRKKARQKWKKLSTERWRGWIFPGFQNKRNGKLGFKIDCFHKSQKSRSATGFLVIFKHFQTFIKPFVKNCSESQCSSKKNFWNG